MYGYFNQLVPAPGVYDKTTRHRDLKIILNELGIKYQLKAMVLECPPFIFGIFVIKWSGSPVTMEKYLINNSSYP